MTHINKKQSMIIGLLIAICLGILLSFSYAKGVDIKPSKQYISIKIEKDDTLWSISKAHMNNDYYTITTYIDEVKNINNLGNDTIIAGDFLIVPLVQ